MSRGIRLRNRRCRNSRGPGPRLATRAGVRRPVHERLAAHRAPAPRARQPLLPVHGERAVEVARLPVDVDVQRVERRAARPRAPRPSPRSPRPAPRRHARRRAGRSAAPSAASPATAPRRRRCCRCPTPAIWSSSARLSSVRRRRSAATVAGEREPRVHRVAGDVRDQRGHQGPVHLDQLVEREAAERALVDEPQLGPVVGEGEPDPQVLLVRRAGRLDQQLAAHAQVREQRLVLVERAATGTCRAATPPRPCARRGGR